MKKFHFLEQLRVIKSYYLCGSFALVDLIYLVVSFFQNPYRICKRYMGQPYGETPLTSFETIGKMLSITSEDHVYELGAGRGKLAFWILYRFGCRVTAIEKIPSFTRFANRIAKIFGKSHIRFLCMDMGEIDFSSATIIYLYGTCLKQEVIEKLIKEFHSLSSKTRIITVSYSLRDIDPRFLVLSTVQIAFPWGITTAYIQSPLPCS